jgi:hypothetical protein
MSETERWDASNSVRFCAHCEGEQGAGISDPGDRACAACGRHDAPHVYVPLATYQRAVADRDRYKAALERLKVYPLLTRRSGPLEQGASQVVRDALRARGGGPG